MRLEKHQIARDGKIVCDADGRPLAVPPPAPTISNPVVRKAIHEVRRHLLAYLDKFHRKPDRVVIEFARGVTDTAKRRNLQLKANRDREQERAKIEDSLRKWGIPESNWNKAVLRVRLCREQDGICPFSLSGPNSNRTITPKMAAEGQEVEIEHILPEGLCRKTMAFGNVVLCFREANSGKGMQTPADWLGPDGVRAMLQRLENVPIRENRPKWERLQLPTPDEKGFQNSQLTDTAYAAQSGGRIHRRRHVRRPGPPRTRRSADYLYHQGRVHGAASRRLGAARKYHRPCPRLGGTDKCRSAGQ